MQVELNLMPMTWMPAVSCAALPVYWRRLEACSRVVVGLCKAFDTQEECQNARAGGMARRLEGRHVRGRVGGREGPERGERDRKRGTRGKGNARLFFERMQARHKTYPFFFANSAAHSRHQEQAKRQAHGVCRSHAFLGASCAHWRWQDRSKEKGWGHSLMGEELNFGVSRANPEFFEDELRRFPLSPRIWAAKNGGFGRAHRSRH